MPNRIILSNSIREERQQTLHQAKTSSIHHTLPAQITKNASSQTFYTIHLLVDRERVQDAYRAYAYFRWVDDYLDKGTLNQVEREAFLERQLALLKCCQRGERLCKLTAEEGMLEALIRSNPQMDTGLQTYIQNLMAVMAFDTARKGRLISQVELDEYSRLLATAVTEALHYYIGHDDDTPKTPDRYLAVTAAHITHMLRDTFEDAAAGYFNIPSEILVKHTITPWDIESEPYRAWVKSRVDLARNYFEAGRCYLAEVENRRCRLAGYAYMARFQGILDAIEKEHYRLRPAYPERKSLLNGLKMGWSVLALEFSKPGRVTR